MRLTRHFKIYLAFSLIIFLGVAVQAWAALQGIANFDGDEAIWALMARHIRQGQIPTYMYGQHYLGTPEIVLAALFMDWLGDSVVALRVVSVLLFGVFLVLCGIVVNRWWGKRVALLSLVILAFPSWRMLWWTFRPFYVFGVMSILGMTALLLFSMDFSQKRRAGYVRWGIFGFMVGLGLWAHPMTLIYFIAVTLVSWLQTPEWSALYRKGQEFCDRVIRIPLRELAPVLSLGLFGLGTLAFFTTGCEPRTSFATAQSLSRTLLLGMGVGFGLMTMGVSPRRQWWFLGALVWGIGFVLGNLPQWRAWVFLDVVPDFGVLSACPTGILPRLRLLVEQLTPAMWGIPLLGKQFTPVMWEMPFLGNLSYYPPLQAYLWILLLVVALIALGVFVWTERLALWSLVSLLPLSHAEGRTVVWGLLFGLPVLLMLLGGNLGDVFHVRHLLVTWQAGAVILALFLVRLVKKSQVLGLCVIGLWVVLVGMGNLAAVGRFWYTQRELNSPQAVVALEDFLGQHHITGGYADYWIAYPLDFLTEERLIFAPYNGLDRYPLYSQEVAELPVRAVVLSVGTVPESSTLDDVIRLLKVGTLGGPAFPGILDWMHTQTVVQRRTIAQWDVWVLADF